MNKPFQDIQNKLVCPVSIQRYPNVLLAHGGGGSLMNNLIEQMFIPTLGASHLKSRHDGALVELPTRWAAFTTDSYVVRPLFFPGGDIGKLAVDGTVNDLAMCGARPLYMGTSFILEEGLSMETLWRVVQSMRAAADESGVELVTGDTKVVERGKGDGLYINTTGIGMIEHDQVVAPSSLEQGDVIVLNGDIGRHGMAIMTVREHLAFENVIESDCAPLWDLVRELLDAGVEIHCLRDLTRGGLASALVEISEAAGRPIHIEEREVPISEEVRGACEILGLDPFHVANEGRFVAFIASKDAERALVLMRKHPLGHSARIIGEVKKGNVARVTMKSLIGTSRIVHMLSGEQLPRIC